MTAFSPRRASILIVDDSPGVLLAMDKLLSPHLPIQVAEGAQSALAAITDETALVITDVRMPGMDGIALTRLLKQYYPHLPVVFMTGIVEDNLRSEARQLGVLDVLRKPLKPGVLLPAIQEWLIESGLELSNLEFGLDNQITIRSAAHRSTAQAPRLAPVPILFEPKKVEMPVQPIENTPIEHKPVANVRVEVQVKVAEKIAPQPRHPEKVAAQPAAHTHSVNVQPTVNVQPKISAPEKVNLKPLDLKTC